MWAWGIAWAMALASVFYMWSVFDSDRQDADEQAAAVGAAAPGAPDLRHVDAYRAFVASPGVSPGPSHEYTAKGIEHLAEAIRTVAEAHTVGNETLAEQRKTFQQKADELRANPTAQARVRQFFEGSAEALYGLAKG
jgi:hypothetical protein